MMWKTTTKRRKMRKIEKSTKSNDGLLVGTADVIKACYCFATPFSLLSLAPSLFPPPVLVHLSGYVFGCHTRRALNLIHRHPVSTLFAGLHRSS
jgi:hypothetical protein